MEQHADNRLIRPRGDYIGPKRRAFTPMTQRGTDGHVGAR
jgi:citrate synthase